MQGKHVILGVTGGIAAYKAAYLVRSLVKAGAEVKVIMTENAKKFVTPLTFSTLSGNPVYTEFFNPENGEWHSHVKLGVWADLFIVAP
ncbi:MAG: phosphopantothenoylcysteine decarboxylase, partial [Paludibacteraceae bacterium]|nr:phosphopantothenoylcysteine decarboxylase [Paludibacteraceae bacterium]